MLPAVIIKLYCFKSFFEKRFSSSNRLFVFLITDNCFDFGCHSNEIRNQAKFLCQGLTACKISNNWTKDSWDIALSFFYCLAGLRLWRPIYLKMRLKTYKMPMSILLKFLTLRWDISRTIWRIEVSDGSFFCVFHALSCEFNLFLDRSFPLMSWAERYM